MVKLLQDAQHVSGLEFSNPIMGPDMTQTNHTRNPGPTDIWECYIKLYVSLSFIWVNRLYLQSVDCVKIVLSDWKLHQKLSSIIYDIITTFTSLVLLRWTIKRKGIFCTQTLVPGLHWLVKHSSLVSVDKQSPNILHHTEFKTNLHEEMDLEGQVDLEDPENFKSMMLKCLTPQQLTTQLYIRR